MLVKFFNIFLVLFLLVMVYVSGVFGGLIFNIFSFFVVYFLSKVFLGFLIIVNLFK